MKWGKGEEPWLTLRRSFDCNVPFLRRRLPIIIMSPVQWGLEMWLGAPFTQKWELLDTVNFQLALLEYRKKKNNLDRGWSWSKQKKLEANTRPRAYNSLGSQCTGLHCWCRNYRLMPDNAVQLHHLNQALQQFIHPLCSSLLLNHSSTSSGLEAI